MFFVLPSTSTTVSYGRGKFSVGSVIKVETSTMRSKLAPSEKHEIA
jgi:hypothetical protein